MDEENKKNAQIFAYYREILEVNNLSEEEIETMRFNVIKVAEILLDYLTTHNRNNHE